MMSELRNYAGKMRNFSLDQVILVFIFVLGIYIRIIEYFANRSMWLDEASLALNVLDKSFYELLTQPLNYNQSAPIGFLLLAKWMVSILGKSEFIFRLIPLISSFISFFILYRLSIKCLPGRFAVLPLFLVATSSEMLRYATEFKQYSSDVLFALIILLYVISFLDKRYTLKRSFVFGLIGAAILWFSFPSLFILGAAGMVLLFVFITEKKWEDARNLVITFLCWCVSFILDYLLFLQGIGGNTAIENYWAYAFMPLPPFTIDDQLWFVGTFLQIFYSPGMIDQALIGSVLFVIGAYASYRNQKTIFLILFSPFLFVLIASSIHKYPFAGRVILFYVPILYIFIAGGLSFLIKSRSYFSKILGTVSLISILYPVFAMSWSDKRFYREEIKPILNYVKAHKQKEDVIYVYYGADRVFQYYLDSYGFENEDYIKGVSSRDNWRKYQEDLDQLKGNNRAWLIFTHVYVAEDTSEEIYMINYLESLGKRLDSFRSVGASVYLYNLTRSL